MNRRASIEEKSLSFSPTAVGTPGVDRSGEIIAGGIQNFAKGLAEREDKADSVAAMAKFGDFNAAYSRGKADLQIKFKEDPKGYVQAAKDLGSQLSTQFSKDLSTGQAKKFREMTTSHTAQDMDNIVGWSVKQDQDNILGGIQKSYGDVALLAEADLTPEGLTDRLASLDVVHNTSADFLTVTSNRAYKLETRKQVIDNSLNARILDNPNLLHGDLVNKKYDSMLTPGEVKKYTKSAFDAMIEGNSRAQYEGLKTASVNLSLTADAIMSGQTSIGEVSRILQVYEMHKDERDVNGNPIVPAEIIKAAESLKEIALKHIPLSKEQKSVESKVALLEFDNQWNAFLSDKKNRETQEGAMTEVKIYANLFDYLQRGVISPVDYNTKKNIMDKKVATRAGKKPAGLTLEESFQKAGAKHWAPWANDDDLFTSGYDMIASRIAQDKNLTPEEKIKYRDQYFLTFIQEVNKLPPQQVNNIRNHELVAASILNGDANTPGLFNRMMIYKHPQTGEPLVYGQVTSVNGASYVFRGINPKTGKSLFDPLESVVQGLENR